MVKDGYLPSYYSDTLTKRTDYPALNQDIKADYLVIGGGLAGLSTAASLIEHGARNVVVLEAGRIAHAASGLNGGQVLPGYSCAEKVLVERLGLDHAQKLYQGTLDAQQIIKGRIQKHKIEAGIMTQGFAQLAWWNNPEELKENCNFYNSNFKTDFEFWSKDKTQQAFRSERFHGAIFSEKHGFQIHPLNYAHGLIAAIVDGGGKIFENSKALSLQQDNNGHVVTTAHGRVIAQQIVIAGGSEIAEQLSPKLHGALLPLHTYIGVTAPLTDEQIQKTITVPYCAYDTRNIMSYFRLVNNQDNQKCLLFGCDAKMKVPDDISSLLKHELYDIFPQLSGTSFQRAWSGQLGYGKDYMPLIGKMDSGVYYNVGHGGHGLATTTLGGEAVAKAMTGDTALLDLFHPFKLRWINNPVGRLIVAPYKLQQMRRADMSHTGKNIATGPT
jgi:gamma-glutamylputrescine oxidase